MESKEFEEGVLTVENALEAVKISEGLVSFQCVIEEKDFCKSLSSRTKRNVDVLAYGTPGSDRNRAAARFILKYCRYKNAFFEVENRRK